MGEIAGIEVGCLLLMVLCGSNAGAQETMDSRWAGVWKENAARSRILIPETLHVRSDGRKTNVVLREDGSRLWLRCADAEQLVACRKFVDAEEAKDGPQSLGVNVTLQADGSELRMDHWRIVPNGDRLTDTDVYRRMGRGNGIVGAWRKVRATEAPTTYRVSLDRDAMSMITPDGEIHVTFSMRAALAPGGAYVATSPTGGNRYRILAPLLLTEESLRNGHVVAQSRITLSQDGRTMVEDHWETGGHANDQSRMHPVRVVYDRVSP